MYENEDLVTSLCCESLSYPGRPDAVHCHPVLRSHRLRVEAGQRKLVYILSCPQPQLNYLTLIEHGRG